MDASEGIGKMSKWGIDSYTKTRRCVASAIGIPEHHDQYFHSYLQLIIWTSGYYTSSPVGTVFPTDEGCLYLATIARIDIIDDDKMDTRSPVRCSPPKGRPR